MLEIHGHRGSRGTHTENTFPSFEEAVQAGADYIELDVQLSKDEVPVVYHDPMLSGRLCYHEKTGILKYPVPVATLSSTEIRQIGCGTYVDPTFPKQKLTEKAHIPILQDVLEWRNKGGEGIGLNIEIKIDPVKGLPAPDPIRFAKIVLRTLKDFGQTENILIQSFDEHVIKAIRSLDDSLPVSWLFSRDQDILRRAMDAGVGAVTPCYRALTASLVNRLHENRIKVLTYTVNHSKKWGELIGLGVDAIITDYPRRLKEFLSATV